MPEAVTGQRLISCTSVPHIAPDREEDKTSCCTGETGRLRPVTSSSSSLLFCRRRAEMMLIIDARLSRLLAVLHLPLMRRRRSGRDRLNRRRVAHITSSSSSPLLIFIHGTYTHTHISHMQSLAASNDTQAQGQTGSAHFCSFSYLIFS